MNTEDKILEKFFQEYPRDAITVIENLDSREIAALLESLQPDMSALLLSPMDRYKAARCLEKIELKIVVDIMEKLPSSLAEALLRQIDTNLKESVLGGLPPEASIPLARMLQYSKNSVGAFIDPMVFTLHEDILAEQGLERIKTTKLHVLPHIYILNQNHSLVGYISLQDLICIDPNAGIQAIIKDIPYQVAADMQASVLLANWDYDEPQIYLPVVDDSKNFLGIITKKNLKRLKHLKRMINRPTIQAGGALGELYQIGLAGLFTSMRIPSSQNDK